MFPVDTDIMEIISFVNSDYNEKKSIGFFKKTKGSFAVSHLNKNRNKRERVHQEKNDVSYALAYPYEFRTFRAGTVKRSISLKTILISIGQAITVASAFVTLNIKKILISIISLASVICLSIGTYNYITYKQNHTGPLTFNYSDSYELETINKMMTTFALDTCVEIDEFGHVLGEVNENIVYKLTEPVSYQTYKVQAGDTIGGIAIKFGLSNISTLISVNNISNVRSVVAGQNLKIPSIDGIPYTVQKGDSINSIAEKNKIRIEDLIDVNELSSEVLTQGQSLFLPGVGLDSNTLKSAMGELFRIPIRASFKWSSPYGNRIDPIKNVQSFHTGTDLACPTGTPIYASMSGTVSYTGVSSVFGNYVIINHTNGYQTLYAHMSKILVKKGQSVGQDTKIGLVGSTGYSTGPHLHFTVYKNGKIVDPMTVLKK